MTILNILQIGVGFLGLIAIAIPFSDNYKLINLKYIAYGILAQVILGLILIKLPLVTTAFEYLAEGVTVLQEGTQKGAQFLFGYQGPVTEGYPVLLETFAFGILPYIIVLSCLSAMMWYWGVLPFIVNMLSKVCQKLFNIGGPIGLGAAANVFLGQVEAPLLIRPYLDKLSNKELLILMTTGMATVAGSVMIALITILQVQFGDINLIQHFITASVLSVPAAIMYANIMIPSNEVTDFEGSKTPKIYKSTMDAITRGTSDGTSIAISIGAILIVFIALVYFANSFLGLIGNQFGLEISIEGILAYVFAPIAWLMGIPWNEAIIAGELLGIKTTLNEFVAYGAMANLEDGLLSDRSKLITLYGLCGFANFSSVGILVSGIGAMAPERKSDLIDVSFKALVGATLASCMTGLVVGCFI
ncbi:Na+-dependent nucleoside transporter [Gammaproteobacteria bacterium]|jgi:CNT family concentrative nucleoside transporter|nr:Na+-dependent nucleoside transporter [Gammaproteobacteria bacterium]MDB9997948.1 Na+-dependent nucleoside transporter [bacterium]MDA8933788.1 Na+-dependent nucleoside transporter [Gammaproteobacteria bacterium]MDA9315014.1 Na+-dependent nucleoside transporter [Gammaproteobacteria bacterium]MDB4135258.1 Na+-dependent nucleoside transporter [Gammaproteobacteria bacterium]|tara:strand:- start:1765 stop:3012 length:1248 start_codon:yes stop_codon:yes gene_type:complete